MDSLRAQRVAEEIKREIAAILRNDLKDPRIGFISVTRVEVSNDLRFAKAFVSVLGDETAVSRTMEALKKATGFVRREIGQRLSLRFTPEIAFRLDTSIEHGVHIAQLLKGVHQGDNRP